MKLKVIVVIVDKNKTERVIAALTERGLNYPQATLGTGTAPGALSEVLGFGETEKGIVLGTAEESVVPVLMNCLKEQFGFEQKGTGIAFTVPVKSVGGPATLRILAGQSAEVKR